LPYASFNFRSLKSELSLLPIATVMPEPEVIILPTLLEFYDCQIKLKRKNASVECFFGTSVSTVVITKTGLKSGKTSMNSGRCGVD